MGARRRSRAAADRRTVAYVRVSTEDQATTGVSLDAQEARIAAYCTAMGWGVSEVVRDAGESAKSRFSQCAQSQARLQGPHSPAFIAPFRRLYSPLDGKNPHEPRTYRSMARTPTSRGHTTRKGKRRSATQVKRVIERYAMNERPSINLERNAVSKP